MIDNASTSQRGHVVDARDAATLQSGDLPNGGAPMPFRVRVSVNTDDVLCFIVDPKDGDYACDTTGLALTVARGGR